MFSKKVLFAAECIGLLVLAGCGASRGGDGNGVPPIKQLRSVSITPSNPVVGVGATQQFKATASYSDGSTGDVSSNASWSSSDKTQATIETAGATNPGLASAIKPGSPNIQATYQGITALTILDVTCPVDQQTGIGLGQVSPAVAPGASLDVIAIVNCENGSSQSITSSVAWSTSNPAAATVATGSSNAGTVTGVAAGTSNIGAVCGTPNCKQSYTAATPVTVRSDAQWIPLLDMTSSQTYLGFPGGLYPDSSRTPPADHDAAGKAAAKAIQPLDSTGSPSPNGAVVFLSIGMSNATIEFSNFISTAADDQSINHSTLAIEDGAHGAVTACPWTVAFGLPTDKACPTVTGVSAENQYDRVRDTVLATAVGAPSAPAGCGTTAVPCLTEAQVQVIWMKNANPGPGADGLASMSASTHCASEVGLPKFKTEACNYEWQMGRIVRAARARYPNLKQIFLSTRIYANYATSALNPEPYAYEYGFSGKWLIEAQIDQVENASGVDPVAGDLDYNSGAAAWLAWGPYIWANGVNKRSDGLFWCNGQTSSPCNGEQDFEPDGTHPSSGAGAQKVVGQLMTFFKGSAYTPSWFCKSGSACN